MDTGLAVPVPPVERQKEARNIRCGPIFVAPCRWDHVVSRLACHAM